MPTYLPSVDPAESLGAPVTRPIVVVPGTGSGSTPPAVGQIWPRGNQP